MRAYRLTDTGRAEMADVAPARPAAGEVVLRVLAAGICGTDLSLLRSRGRGLELPVTLGHEIVGEVIEHGEGVDTPGRGTLVAVYELLGCGSCAACAQAQDNLCRNVVPGAIGITTDGGMAEQVVVPARNLVALGRLDPVQAAPLTDAGLTALHAVEHGRRVLERGSTAVVVGIGGLGHLAVQFLRATSEARILAVDVDRARLDFAADLGADDGVLAGPDAGAGWSQPMADTGSTPSSTSSARRRAWISPLTWRAAAAPSSSPAAVAAGSPSPPRWAPAARPTARSRSCTRSAGRATTWCGRWRSPRPAASARIPSPTS